MLYTSYSLASGETPGARKSLYVLDKGKKGAFAGKNGLALVDALEIEYGIQFTISEITDVKNTLDIKRHLKNHGIEIE